MRVNLDNLFVDNNVKETLHALLRVDTGTRSDLEQMWYLMDRVWDEYNCDNVNYNWIQIEMFYNHPVWLLNGLFIEQDEVSMQHRKAISDSIIGKTTKDHDNFKLVVDYGGGYGTLARLIAEKDTMVNIIIYEPHPSELAVKKCLSYNNITFSDRLPRGIDCLVTTDVIEHVPNPLEVLFEIVTSVKTGGYLVIAYNFYPVIKCHLPATFYLRYTFGYFAKYFGLKKLGSCEGSHADIYLKTKHKQKVNWKALQIIEKALQTVFPLMELTHKCGIKVKGLLRRITESFQSNF